MSDWSRRDLLKGALAASLGGLVPARRLADGLAELSPSDTPRPAGPERAAQVEGPRLRQLLDAGWRFHLGNAADPAQDFGFGVGQMFAKTGALFLPSKPDFDDAAWRSIDVPHDWAVELPFENRQELIEFGSKPLGRAYPATSIGWYRRVFTLPAADAGRRVALEFDGVFRDCIVALNGHLLGRNASGYVPFRYDVTDYANFGDRNVLVVRVDATGREGWFYEGAGIYRHVWLVTTEPLHVGHWGTFVSSDIRGAAATLAIVTETENDADSDATFRLVHSVRDARGAEVASVMSEPLTLGAWSRSESRQQVVVDRPALWSVDAPNLYTLVTSVMVGGTAVDRHATPFGIRSIRFDARDGFFLNGERLELKGTCNHQDHAGVGSALPDRLQAYRIERLKEMGANAYRTSHNPPTPELLDACDRLGMLVLDETRWFSSEPTGLSQLERLIRRDRNHPSVFCWSVGNEEWVVEGNDHGRRIADAMVRLAHRLDPSRPVTAAMDGRWGKEGISPALDVQGCNYQQAKDPAHDIDTFHAQFPDKPMMGSEVGSTVSTRGIYVNDATRGYVSAYDVNHPPWAALAEEWWPYYAARRFLAGGFVWTGFDYRGEPTPYGWPCISSHFGIMDTCGFPKDNFYYYQAWWSGRPVLHLFPHWNWAGKEGQEIEVWCHTNLEQVELFLNGRSLGAKPVPRNSHVAWSVPYAAGTLEARGRGGRTTLTAKRETTGSAAGIVLVPDRGRIAADGEDVSVVEVRVVDTTGRVVPIADDEITFRVTGSGKLIGVGNGDPSSHEADKGTTRRAFNGLCVAIVQATQEPGPVAIEATAPGLAPGHAVITGDPATPRPAVP
jgi:beta-galactosidase